MSHAHVKLLTPSAQMPERTTTQAAGLDVRADLFDQSGAPRILKINNRKEVLPQTEGNLFGFYLQPGDRVLIPTGISMETSPDIYTRVAPRSGLSLKNGIDVFAGVVDADFRGEVGVLIHNADPEEAFFVSHGMRIAQLVLTKISLDQPELTQSHPDSDRSNGGFGSTGVN
jgi:dUTP pyrophosphatase